MSIIFPKMQEKMLDECAKCNNKCDVCPFKNTESCDFRWIYSIGNTEDELLGYWLPNDIKSILIGKNKNNYIIGTDDHLGFCHFNVVFPKGIKEGYIKIDHMCVDKKHRGLGIGKEIVDYIVNNEYGLPVRVACLSKTTADTFWKHTAEKYNGKLIEQKHTSIDRIVNVYEFGENHFTEDKEELW